MMRPPMFMSVADKHGGCTVEEAAHASGDVSKVGDTVWVKPPITKQRRGKLIPEGIDQNTTYQGVPAVSAKYKVEGWKCPVVIWWNDKGERIA